MAGDVLSQSEIDALLSALSTGEMSADDIKKEEEAKKVKVYDFKRALRFSKDQIRSLTRIHENFARLLTTFFSAQLRTYVQITVASVDQIPFEEFIRSIPNMTLINVFEVPPLDGNILMEINPNIAYSMLDRLMGGSGSSHSNVDNLTEIETKIMTNLFERSFDNLREAWANIADIDPILNELEVNPQFLQMISPNETVVVISFNSIIGETSGMINICIPHVVLEPIVPNLSVRYWMQSNKADVSPEQTAIIEKRVKQSELEVVAQLGDTDISIEDFLTLQYGDVLQLDQKISDPLTLSVGGIPKFTIQPGTIKKRMAVQIIDSLKGGDDDE
ncbi:flagellar motor switch protein FliM [Rummeliibacillus sp. G93]|uniref:Flagellar motor switch protein FliM n=1 Tax=Rummeliibacillus stabekisii TaxID=241244 RepID=A0A143H9V6_9BACL|nr:MULTISPECIES: flagellar motor switch protein FliM [Rummeliibacillus]AMW98498.1 flagellar motor switch protein FliM [Rummeliibacillus stabekisii]MBB5169873.1 flagellar motor switch protein FliM [Rummeliibacillus stabekisii]MCM3315823.1 flagellar motor switch protein FliM [Rummeliibacillus stabekisii]UQW98390.1 flagellar motor switch protein FliM [Rummeliibacillus sp. G93]GEL04131.1 flagellar motor switch protein FliM [Rummeliibacillus stabekisii]